MNKFISVEEMAKELVDSLNKYADEYQKETDCTEEEKQRFKAGCLQAFAEPLMNGPMKMGK